MKFKGIRIEPKWKIKDKDDLALVYTPGVGAASKAIADNEEASFVYTNRLNSVAVISEDYNKALKRAIFLKDTLLIDAYPLCINELELTVENLVLVVNNIEPNFKGIDLTCMKMPFDEAEFDVSIPVLREPVEDIEAFFGCLSRFGMPKLEGELKEKALQLRDSMGGVISTVLSEEETKKPIAIVSDGSAVLGLGDIGAYAALPVMEGKSVLFKELGGVDAVPLCLKTQKPGEIVRIIMLLEDSFSGVNLEDISAPRCFKIEESLKKKSKIMIFHDDQHGTAIVVLAALLNALHLVKKKLDEVKVVFSGAGAAGQAVCKLLLEMGFKNIVLNDENGAIFRGRKENDNYLENMARCTNPYNERGMLSDTIKRADVFIGLSAPNVLTPKMVMTMADNPIVFALANPIPEINPNLAKASGAYIVASGRSDFENQVNNALAFPGLFKGALENNLDKITDEIKIECALAIASLVEGKELTPNHIIPDALDMRVPEAIAESIADIV